MAPAHAERTDFSNHVVIAFESHTQARGARNALAEIGYAADQVRQWTEAQFLEGLKAAIDVDRQDAGLPCHADSAQKARCAGDESQGAPRYHWLIVGVRNDGRGQQVVDCVRRFGPQSARHYRQASVVELLENRFPSLSWPTRHIVDAD